MRPIRQPRVDQKRLEIRIVDCLDLGRDEGARFADFGQQIVQLGERFRFAASELSSEISSDA